MTKYFPVSGNRHDHDRRPEIFSVFTNIFACHNDHLELPLTVPDSYMGDTDCEEHFDKQLSPVEAAAAEDSTTAGRSFSHCPQPNTPLLFYSTQPFLDEIITGQELVSFLIPTKYKCFMSHDTRPSEVVTIKIFIFTLFQLFLLRCDGRSMAPVTL